MDLATTYLFEKLSETFSSSESVRISPLQRSGLQRAIDLPQDYDPEQSTLHRQRGVVVRIYGREFIFESELVDRKDYAGIDKLIAEAQRWLESR